MQSWLLSSLFERGFFGWGGGRVDDFPLLLLLHSGHSTADAAHWHPCEASLSPMLAAPGYLFYIAAFSYNRRVSLLIFSLEVLLNSSSASVVASSSHKRGRGNATPLSSSLPPSKHPATLDDYLLPKNNLPTFWKIEIFPCHIVQEFQEYRQTLYLQS